MEGGGLGHAGFLNILLLDTTAPVPCPLEVLFAERGEDVVDVCDIYPLFGTHPTDARYT